jgi:DNA-binding LytR/AlgR family response regulator
MTTIRVLVCDDEPLAVRRLSSMLSRLPEVEIAATASNGREALDLLPHLDFDLALLDIEMPEIDGFDVVEAMTSGALMRQDVPLIAFVTAFRRFAPKAFDSGAIDFLPKPVRLARLEQTLARAREAMAGRQARRRLIDLQGKLDELRDNRDPYREAHIWVPRRGENMRVDLDQVDRVVAEGPYVRLHVESNSFLHRQPISLIESKLDPARFLRVHRSHLVRIDYITAIRRTVHGGAELVLRDGERVPVGRKYSRAVRRRVLEADNTG